MGNPSSKPYYIPELKCKGLDSSVNSNQYSLLLLGKIMVGKTCIISQFKTGKFNENNMTTIGWEKITCNFKFPDGKSISFTIFDNGGQERFKTISLSPLKKGVVNSIILVYDITDESSFDFIKSFWNEDIKKYYNKNIILAVVANKNDLDDKRDVPNEKGEEFAKSIGAMFFPVSAKNKEEIKNLFYSIGKKILFPGVGAIKENEKVFYFLILFIIYFIG